MNEIAGHVEEGVLQALADGELDAAAAERVERHLIDCAACRDELDSLHQASLALSGALRELDRPATATTPFRPAVARRSAAWSGWDALPRAAVLVLGLAAAASATIPGSPVRDWMESLIPREPDAVASRAGDAPIESAGAAPQPAELSEAGVSVAAENGAIRVAVTEAGAGLLVTAVLTDGERGGVYATGPAAGARFTTGPGRIGVAGAESGGLRVEIPRGAATASLSVNGRVYVTKDGDSLRLADPATGRRIRE